MQDPLDIAFKSVFLLVSDPTAGQQTIGTGFFIGRKEDDAFLATAAHVASAMTSNSTIVLPSKSGTPVEVSLKDISQIPIEEAWVFDKRQDLAILRISPPKFSSELDRLDPKNEVVISVIPTQALWESSEAPNRNIPITLVGFPIGSRSQLKFSPVTRETNAASGMLTFTRSDTKTEAEGFATQDPSVGGYSGGTVINTQKPFSIGGAMNFPSIYLNKFAILYMVGNAKACHPHRPDS